MEPKAKLLSVSNQLYEKNVLHCLNENYKYFAADWMSHQVEFLNDLYSGFKDHYKLIIVIYLINKTLSFYSTNFTKLNYEEFFSKDSIEIEKFTIMEISKSLFIPKETARRKIKELENLDIIQRKKETLLINKLAFNYVKPTKGVTRISRFINRFANVLHQNEMLKKKIESQKIEKIIKQNFSYVWHLYYNLQIKMISLWIRYFKKDPCLLHVWSACIFSQVFAERNSINVLKSNNINILNKRENFNENIGKAKFSTGINAMSISDLTGIPRATVVRKLHKLTKLNHLKVNKKKQFLTTGEKINELNKIQSIVIQNLSRFLTKVINIV